MLHTDSVKKNLSPGFLSRFCGSFLLLVFLQLQGTAQKLSESATPQLSFADKNQVASKYDVSALTIYPDQQVIIKKPVVSICPTEWLGNSVLIKSFGIDKTKTIELASEKLPSGGHSLFYAVDGNQKFVRFPKK